MQPSLGNEYARYRRIKRIPWNVQSLFAHGREGAYYTHDLSGQRHFQDFNMTPADALGDPVRIQLADNSIGNTPVAFFDGTSGCYFSTPDSAALDITGDIGFYAFIALNNYASGAFQAVTSKWIVSGQRSFQFVIGTAGAVGIWNTTDGVTGVFTETTTLLPSIVQNGAPVHIRGSLDVDNGSSQKVLTVEYSLQPAGTPIDQLVWIPFQTRTVAGATSIFAGTAQLEVGAYNVGTTSPASGKIYRAQVYAGLDFSDLRADSNPSDYSGAGATWDSSTTGETWTRNGTAYIAPDGFHRVADADAKRPQLARVPRGQTLYQLLNDSDDLEGAAWTKNNAGTGTEPIITPGYPDPEGGNTAFRLQANSGVGGTLSDQSIFQQSLGSVFTNPHDFNSSIWAVSNTGSSQLVVFRNSGGEGGSSENVTTSWQRLEKAGARTNTTSFMQIGSRGTFSDQVVDIIIWHPMFKLGQTPADYQSRGAGTYDITQSGIPDSICLYHAGSQYTSIQGSKNWTWMHDGTGGNAVMGVIVAKEDDGATDTFAGSRTGSTQVGFKLYLEDTGAVDGSVRLLESNGTTNIVAANSADQTALRYSPMTLATSSDGGSSPDASVLVGGVVVATANASGTPSVLAASNDITVFSDAGGVGILPGYEFASIFAQDLSAQQFRQAQRWVANRIGSDFT